MSILNHFRDWQTVPIEIKRESNVFDPITGDTNNSDSSIGTFDAIYYLGAQGEGVLAEKIRENVAATAIFDPDVDVRVKDELEVNSLVYNCIYIDDVALRGEAIVCALALKA